MSVVAGGKSRKRAAWPVTRVLRSRRRFPWQRLQFARPVSADGLRLLLETGTCSGGDTGGRADCGRRQLAQSDTWEDSSMMVASKVVFLGAPIVGAVGTAPTEQSEIAPRKNPKESQ